jgi:hypothetical protein
MGQGLARSDIYPLRASVQGFLDKRPPYPAVASRNQNHSVRDSHNDILLIELLDDAVAPSARFDVRNNSDTSRRRDSSVRQRQIPPGVSTAEISRPPK